MGGHLPGRIWVFAPGVVCCPQRAALHGRVLGWGGGLNRTLLELWGHGEDVQGGHHPSLCWQADLWLEVQQQPLQVRPSKRICLYRSTLAHQKTPQPHQCLLQE